MKRFVNIGNQIEVDGIEQFSFFCTVLDKYEKFNGEQVWDNAFIFLCDYSTDGGDQPKRYMNLIPNRFKKISKVNNK